MRHPMRFNLGSQIWIIFRVQFKTLIQRHFLGKNNFFYYFFSVIFKRLILLNNRSYLKHRIMMKITSFLEILILKFV